MTRFNSTGPAISDELDPIDPHTDHAAVRKADAVAGEERQLTGSAHAHRNRQGACFARRESVVAKEVASPHIESKETGASGRRS